MKYLMIFFFASCLMKVTTFGVKEIVKVQGKEYEIFYEAEAYRKYLEHSQDYSNLSLSVQQNRGLPKSLVPKDSEPDTDNRYELMFERTWFQEYVCLLNQHIPTANLSDGNHLQQYPKKLLNTVREDYSRDEVYSYYEKYEWFKIKYLDSKVKGVITEIHERDDEVSVKILPYTYATSIETYENFEKDGQRFRVDSNPFQYAGSLKGISCTMFNPVTCESQSYHFD